MRTPSVFLVGLLAITGAVPASIRVSAQDAPPLPPGSEIVATGLRNPRGMVIDDDGTLYIVEAGLGGTENQIIGPEGAPEGYGNTSGLTIVKDGIATRVVDDIRGRAHLDGNNAIGLNDITFGTDGTLYGVIGFGGDPKDRAAADDPDQPQLATLVTIDPASGAMTTIADLGAYEQENNPDGGAIDTNPYAILTLPDGDLLVADAGANDLLRVTPAGEISTVAVFPDTEVTAPDGSSMMPMNAVPDAVALGLDGAISVGQLTGVPFPVGGATVFTVPAAGGAPTAAETGFTNIIDLGWNVDGSLWVLEMMHGGMMAADPADPTTLEGRLIRIAPDGTRTDVAGSNLFVPTNFAFGPEGDVYVTVNAIVGEQGMVIRVPLAVQQ